MVGAGGGGEEREKGECSLSPALSLSLSQKKKKKKEKKAPPPLTVRQPQLRPRVLVLRQLGPDQARHLGVPRQPLLPALDVAQQPLVLVELGVAVAEDVEVGRDLGLGLALDLARDADGVVAAVLQCFCFFVGIGVGESRERRREIKFSFSFSFLLNERKSALGSPAVAVAPPTHLLARPDERAKVPPVPVGEPARQQRLPLRRLLLRERLRVVGPGRDLRLHHLLRRALRARRPLLLGQRVPVRLVRRLLLVEGGDALDVVELEVLEGRHLGQARGGGRARAPAPAAAELHRLAVVVALVVGRDALALALGGVDPVAADQRAEGLAVGARGGAVGPFLAVLELVDVADAAVKLNFSSFSFWLVFCFFSPLATTSGPLEGKNKKEPPQTSLLPPPSPPPPLTTHPSSVNFIAPSANCCIFWLRSSVALSPFLMIASMSSSVSEAASDEKTISAP